MGCGALQSNATLLDGPQRENELANDRKHRPGRTKPGRDAFPPRLLHLRAHLDQRHVRHGREVSHRAGGHDEPIGSERSPPHHRSRPFGDFPPRTALPPSALHGLLNICRLWMIGFTQLWRKLSVIFRTGSRSSSTMAQSPPCGTIRTPARPSLLICAMWFPRGSARNTSLTMLTIPSLGDSPTSPPRWAARETVEAVTPSCRAASARDSTNSAHSPSPPLISGIPRAKPQSRWTALPSLAGPPFSARPGVLSPSPRKRGHFPLTRLVAAGYASPAFGPPLPLLL